MLVVTSVEAANPEEASLILTSAPRGDHAAESATYQPVADFLSKTTGQKVIYKFSDNWLTYQNEMRKGKYDIIFDGPHFVSWRLYHMDHVPLVKLPQQHIWVVVAKSEDNETANLTSLYGRAVCSPAPPNFGALTLYSLFPNPAREPVIVETKSWQDGFTGVTSGKCKAAIIPQSNWKKFDPEGKLTKIVYKHRAFPNQAITVSSKRIPPAMQQKMRVALLSDDGQAAMKQLREQYAKVGNVLEKLVPATKAEYADVDLILKDVRGFEFTPEKNVIGENKRI
jgi:ABC-type phosphate/phosphonate transport system substrate-binding protein